LKKMYSSDNSSSDELYRLRWDSSKQVNDISNAFQSFRNDQELLDVSLVCSSSNGRNKTLRAHKVVLAAYSTVFKNIFRSLSDRRDPVVYLKGITHGNLSFILDFMYQGNVDIPKSMINDFFADAQELQIKGLRKDDNEDDSLNEQTRSKKLISKSFDAMKEAMKSRKRVKMEEEEPVLIGGFDEEETSNLKRARRVPSKATLKTELEDNSNDDPLDHSFPKKEKRPLNISSFSDEDKARIEAMYEKTENWAGSESKKRCLYSCKLCSMEVRSDRRAYHLVRRHPN